MSKYLYLSTNKFLISQFVISRWLFGKIKIKEKAAPVKRCSPKHFLLFSGQITEFRIRSVAIPEFGSHCTNSLGGDDWLMPANVAKADLPKQSLDCCRREVHSKKSANLFILIKEFDLNSRFVLRFSKELLFRAEPPQALAVWQVHHEQCLTALL